MPDLLAVDDALVRLRRLWSARSVVDDGGRRVEMSSVLVVEACARGAAAGEEVGIADVAAFADVEQSTASRLVDRAERAGLVRRARSARDTRRTAVVLTPEGAQVRERAVAFRAAWLAAVLADWDPADVAALGALLGRFAAAVAEHGPPGAPTPPEEPR